MGREETAYEVPDEFGWAVPTLSHSCIELSLGSENAVSLLDFYHLWLDLYVCGKYIPT